MSLCVPKSPSTAWPRAIYSSSAEFAPAKKFCSRSACSSRDTFSLPSPYPPPPPALLSAPLKFLACPPLALPPPNADDEPAAFAYGFSGVSFAYGLRPSSSFRFWLCTISSRADLTASNSRRYSASSVRKLRIRSLAFSCLAGLSSCLASELYSSIVRWKAVREALREPSAAGLRSAFGVEDAAVEEEERAERSLRIEVLCLRALLKVVF